MGKDGDGEERSVLNLNELCYGGGSGNQASQRRASQQQPPHRAGGEIPAPTPSRPEGISVSVSRQSGSVIS